MDIIGETFVFTVLNLIGGVIRWLFASLWNLIFNTSKQPLKEYIYHPDDDTKLIEGGNGCLNTVVGILFVIVVVTIITKI